MKLFLLALIVLLSLGCTNETKHGPCIGIFDEKDPKKIYKLSGWNIAVAVIFAELVVPPIIVAVDETFCPVGNK